MSNLVGGLYTI